MIKRNIKLATLIANVVAIIITSIILIGSTFAWFTDSVSSSGNKIQAGTLEVDLKMYDKEEGWISLKDEEKAIFDYDKWEPGYTDVKLLMIENKGNLALKWKAKLVADFALTELADVIDVYVASGADEIGYPENRDLEGYTLKGTLAEYINDMEDAYSGILLAGEDAYLNIVLKMRSTVGNEYQGLSIGGEFDIQLIATQLSNEEDGFGFDYDSEATLEFTPVSSLDQFKRAIQRGETNIVLTDNIVMDSSFEIANDVKIDGNGYTITRTSLISTFSLEEPVIYDGVVFNVAAGKTLELVNIVVDGGAEWIGEEDAVLKRGIENAGVVSQDAIIKAANNSKIILGEGTVIQNCAGATAINLGMRAGATLTINGAKIINNFSGAGAIWGGGHIVINSGEISGNASSGVAGAIRMVSSCNLTMNGGVISNNKATTYGGAIYTYGASTITLAGGEISNNFADLGGAIYSDGAATYVFDGDFKLINNTANQGGGMRLENRTVVVMKNGLISGNVSLQNPTWAGFYGYNPIVTLSGGVIEDSIVIHGGLTPTIGDVEVTGVINFAISTNHNTCNLAENFGTIKFHVAEGENFAAFNFKPAANYEYAEGDELKFICTNEGYVTYYDQDTKTFRIKLAENE